MKRSHISSSQREFLGLILIFWFGGRERDKQVGVGPRGFFGGVSVLGSCVLMSANVLFPPPPPIGWISISSTRSVFSLFFLHASSLRYRTTPSLARAFPHAVVAAFFVPAYSPLFPFHACPFFRAGLFLNGNVVKSMVSVMFTRVQYICVCVCVYL